MLGEKLFEEKAELGSNFIEVTDEGVMMKQSFQGEIMGMGKFPSGMNMTSGHVKIKPTGKAWGKWNGMIMTKDGDMVVWWGHGNSMRSGPKVSGLMTITYMTMSEKLKWMNQLLVVAEVHGEMNNVMVTGHEWKL